MNRASQPIHPNPNDDSYLTKDVFLMGGLSIFVSLLVWLTVDKGESLFAVSQLAFVLAFAVNHPHFLSSYILLYRDSRMHILRRPRYFWSAVVVPIVLGSVLVVSLLTSNKEIMAHVITSMFFFVGWHYVKQVFGCIIVTTVQRKMYYSVWERRLLLTNLFAMWFLSWATSQVSYGPAQGVTDNAFLFYDIPHYRLNLHPLFLQTSYVVLALTLLGIVVMHLHRYIRLGWKPSPPAVAAFFALYAWYIPAAVHPAFAFFIPLFHSLQYLAFVWSLKKNQVAHEIQELSGTQWRSAWTKKFIGFFVLAVVLGALAFEWVPKLLDSQGLVHGLGSSPFLVAFLLFVNIHHYFIDNTIWRADNATVKQFLFSPAQR